MKKSIPTPLSTIFPASFLNPGWSVWNSFFSLSMPWRSFLSLRNNLPGPQVGSDAKEQTIFPPVALRDDTADSRVGNKAGSGFFTCEKSLGNCARRDMMMDLVGQHCSIFANIDRVGAYFDLYGSTNSPLLPRGTNGSSMSDMTSICACSNSSCLA